MRLKKYDSNSNLVYGFYEPNGEIVIFTGYFKNGWLRNYCINNNDIGYSFTNTNKSFNI